MPRKPSTIAATSPAKGADTPRTGSGAGRGNGKPAPGTAAASVAAKRSPRGPAAAEAGADQATTRVLRQFRLVFNAVKTHFQQVEKRAGVGGAQLWALSVIRQQPGIGMNGLAAALDVRQPTASNLVRSLLAQGLVEVRREGSDRRAVQLYLLPEARAVLRKAPGPFTGVLPQALAALDAATLERLEADLTELIRVLAPDASAARVPLAQL